MSADDRDFVERERQAWRHDFVKTNGVEPDYNDMSSLFPTWLAAKRSVDDGPTAADELVALAHIVFDEAKIPPGEFKRRLVALSERTSALDRVLNPRQWTDAMVTQWQAKMPNVYEAFEALRSAIDQEKKP